ncbi:MAG: helix-turn-helix domain-containing protein [Erysipelotrichia bacterium]|nr:helix-turn-helix domain-containing protein [Erysipelotrichia bacterium]
MHLTLGESIATLRKQKKMTQTQLAALLHVSNVTVSKWENNNTYPDISLLKPLARCLDTSVDELLNFHAFLEDEKMNEHKEKIVHLFESGQIEKAMQYTQTLLKEYPTDLALKFQIASLYFRYATIKKEESFALKQIDQALLLYEQSVYSEDEIIQNASKQMLISLYCMKEQFDKALAILDSLPKALQDVQMMKASILYQQGKQAEALKLEQMCIWQELSNLRLNMLSISKNYAQQNRKEEALTIIEKALALSILFSIDELFTMDMNLYLLKIELLLSLNRKKEALYVFTKLSTVIEKMCMLPSKDNLFFNQLTLNINSSTQFMIQNTIMLFTQDEKLESIRKEKEYLAFIKLLKQAEH